MMISGKRTEQLDIIAGFPPRRWLYEWFSQFHSCGTYSVLTEPFNSFASPAGVPVTCFRPNGITPISASIPWMVGWQEEHPACK